jgi:hypothetical protein
MPKNLAPILIGVVAAVIVSFLMGLASASGGEDPGLTPLITGLCFGVVTTIVLHNLSGNRKVADAGGDAKRQALAFAAEPGRAALYLVREGFIGMAAGMNLSVDGREVVQLKSPRFTRVSVAPGAHTLTASFGGGLAAQTKPVDCPFEAAVGEIVVLRLTMGIGATKNPVQVERVNVDWARTQLRNIRMSAPDVASV